MENSKKSNCCAPNQEATSNCCPPSTTNENNATKEKSTKGFKQKIGMLILGLAVIFAMTTAFKNNGSIGDLPPSIEDFTWLETDKKVAYVLIEGADDTKNEKMALKVTSFVEELNETEGSAYFTQLNAANEHYENFVEKIGVEETPTIVVLGRGGNTSLLSTSINSINLVKAYVSATTQATSCNPAACSPADKAKCVAKKSKS